MGLCGLCGASGGVLPGVGVRMSIAKTSTSDLDVPGEIAAEPARNMGVTVAKNLFALAVAVSIWLAINTGYFGPDRPTRPQWARLEKAKTLQVDALTYQADFTRIKAGEPTPSGIWTRYNGATPSTTEFNSDGIGINYANSAWLGAAFRLSSFVPDRIYRITFQANTDTEPAAILVRNRQMDMHRESIPVGNKQHVVHFMSPTAPMDQTQVIFMPDGRSQPKGKFTLTSLKIELLKE
jgi:hypothetical protein